MQWRCKALQSKWNVWCYIVLFSFSLFRFLCVSMWMNEHCYNIAIFINWSPFHCVHVCVYLPPIIAINSLSTWTKISNNVTRLFTQVFLVIVFFFSYFVRTQLESVISEVKLLKLCQSQWNRFHTQNLKQNRHTTTKYLPTFSCTVKWDHLINWHRSLNYSILRFNVLHLKLMKPILILLHSKKLIQRPRVWV